MSINPRDTLKLKKALSETVPVTTSVSVEAVEEAVAKHLGSSALIVAWQINRIVWGRVENGKIIFADVDSWNVAQCQEMRIFNDSKELYLMKSGDKLTGRLRIDGSGEDTAYVDSVAPIWGKAAGSDGEFTELRDEARKLYITIPADVAKDKRCGLVTRSYVVSDEASGLSGYGDYRYLALQELGV